MSTIPQLQMPSSSRLFRRDPVAPVFAQFAHESAIFHSVTVTYGDTVVRMAGRFGDLETFPSLVPGRSGFIDDAYGNPVPTESEFRLVAAARPRGSVFPGKLFEIFPAHLQLESKIASLPLSDRMYLGLE